MNRKNINFTLKTFVGVNKNIKIKYGTTLNELDNLIKKAYNVKNGVKLIVQGIQINKQLDKEQTIGDLIKADTQKQYTIYVVFRPLPGTGTASRSYESDSSIESAAEEQYSSEEEPQEEQDSTAAESADSAEEEDSSAVEEADSAAEEDSSEDSSEDSADLTEMKFDELKQMASNMGLADDDVAKFGNRIFKNTYIKAILASLKKEEEASEEDSAEEEDSAAEEQYSSEEEDETDASEEEEQYSSEDVPKRDVVPSDAIY